MGQPQRKRSNGRSKDTDLDVQRGVGKVNTRGQVRYAVEFRLAVVDMARKHTVEEAADYFGCSPTTVSKWLKQYAELDRKAEGKAGRVSVERNPYRETPYGIGRRLDVSDKLFAELEFTLEVTKLQHGYVPAETLGRLINGYGNLVEKRRLEEGAFTALVAAVKDPEAIYEEGEAQVVAFRRRASLPAGE